MKEKSSDTDTKNTRRVDQINETKHSLIQQCCDLVEDVLNIHLQVLKGSSDCSSGTSANDCIQEPNFVTKMRHHHDQVTNRNIYEANETDSSASTTIIDWDAMPPSLTPEGGGLKGNRALHKRKQVQALIDAILPLVDMLYDQKQNKMMQKKNGRGKYGDVDDTSTDGSLDETLIHVVDIGAGSGHVGLVVAWMRPLSCRVTLLERKEYGSRQAERRAKEADLLNVLVANTSLHAFSDYNHVHEHEHEHVQEHDPKEGDGKTQKQPSSSYGMIGPAAIQFDLAISLHSCGVLTDAALEMCALNRAAFCLCPCCYGQTSSNDVLRPYMPRSVALRSLREAQMPEQWNKLKRRGKGNSNYPNEIPKPFTLVAKSADCASAVDGIECFVKTRNFALAKRCMQIVDADRICLMSEYGYSGEIASLSPLEVTPKNNIIIGIPKERMSSSDDYRRNMSTARTSRDRIPTLALKASAVENFESEEGEKDDERERIRAAHERWKHQFQDSLNIET